MSDTSDDWAAYKEQQKQERAQRRAAAERILKNEGLQYTVHNEGAHIVILVAGAIFDFWPGTDRWRMRDFKGQFGVQNMLAAIRQRKIVHLDFAKIEERVMAQTVDAGRLASEPGRFALHGTTLRTTGARYPGTSTGRIVDNTPPWQDLPVDEDKAYVDKMEKAYPHLSGPDEKP